MSLHSHYFPCLDQIQNHSWYAFYWMEVEIVTLELSFDEEASWSVVRFCLPCGLTLIVSK